MIQREIVVSFPYRHAVFRNQACVQADAAPSFVFLGGDGNSWIRRGRVSADPTPEHDVALELIAAEETCSVYIARPCTYDLAAIDNRCSPSVWTVDRYSTEVLQSIAGVIDAIFEPEDPIVWVGYSGGGLLASHLADRLPQTRGLITLGGNLDLAAWLTHHEYTREPLDRSPPTSFPLDERIHQLHVFGENDRTSPAALAESVVPQASIIILEGADHDCCWAERWLEIHDAYRAVVNSR